MKKCPFCAEDIQDEAIKCKHCLSMLNTATSPQQSTSTTAPPPPSKKPIDAGALALVPTDLAWVRHCASEINALVEAKKFGLAHKAANNLVRSFPPCVGPDEEDLRAELKALNAILPGLNKYKAGEWVFAFAAVLAASVVIGWIIYLFATREPTNTELEEAHRQHEQEVRSYVQHRMEDVEKRRVHIVIDR